MVSGRTATVVLALTPLLLGAPLRAAPQGDGITIQGTAGMWTLKSVRTTCVMAGRPTGSLTQPPEITGSLRDDGGFGFYMSGFAGGDRISATKGKFTVAIDGRSYGEADFTPGGGTGALAYGPSLRVALGPDFRRAFAAGRVLTLTRSDGVAATPLRFDLRDVQAAFDALAACDKRVGRPAPPPPPPQGPTRPFSTPGTIGAWTIDPAKGCQMRGSMRAFYGSLRMATSVRVTVISAGAGYRLSIVGIPTTMLEPKDGLTLAIGARKFPMQRRLDATLLRSFEAMVDGPPATLRANRMVLSGTDREIATVTLVDFATGLEALALCRPRR